MFHLNLFDRDIVKLYVEISRWNFQNELQIYN